MSLCLYISSCNWNKSLKREFACILPNRPLNNMADMHCGRRLVSLLSWKWIYCKVSLLSSKWIYCMLMNSSKPTLITCVCATSCIINSVFEGIVSLWECTYENRKLWTLINYGIMVCLYQNYILNESLIWIVCSVF